MRCLLTLAVVLWVAAVAVGCIFFTSGTGGYTAEDAGAKLGCQSDADCDEDGGNAGSRATDASTD
jgi:hypothetical protein